MINNKEIIELFKNLKVLVVGDAILDAYLHGNTHRICREAPVPLVEAQEELCSCGGAANTAINVRAMGAQTTFVSVLGSDEAGRKIEQLLQESHVDTSSLLFSPQRKTISKRRIVVGGNIVLRVDDGCTTDVDASMQKKLLSNLGGLLPRFDALLVSDYQLGMLTDGVIDGLATLIRDHPIPVFLDSRNAARLAKLHPYAVKPNWEEAVSLVQLPSGAAFDRLEELKKQKDNLLKLTGAKYVVATVDTEGAVILSANSEPYHIATRPENAKNTIGAGDTFISALTLASAAGAPIEQAAEIASAAASIVIQQDGTVRCTHMQLAAHFKRVPKLLAGTGELSALAEELHKKGKRIVFTNGCFDLIHKGHVNMLHQARQEGDVLVVGVNSDASAGKVKGPGRPVNTLEDRISVLAALESVDYLIPFEEENPVEVIRLLQPHVFVKGSGYTVDTIPEARLLKELNCRVLIVNRYPSVSTSDIIHKIHEMT